MHSSGSLSASAKDLIHCVLLQDLQIARLRNSAWHRELIVHGVWHFVHAHNSSSQEGIVVFFQCFRSSFPSVFTDKIIRKLIDAQI